MERRIDLDKWPRKSQYELFKTMDSPHFNICANIDITKLRKFIKRHDLPFYTTMIYITTKVANSIPAFRLRMRGEEVIEHSLVHPSFTIMTQPEVFSFCGVDYIDLFQSFIEETEKKKSAMMGNVNVEDEANRDDYLFITSLPWITFTSVSHPINLGATDCVPRIAWGKFFSDHDKILMPFSVQVNHAMMDGYHVGMYYESLQKALDDPESFLV